MASCSLQIYGNLLVQIKKNHIVTLICSLSLDQHYYKSFSVLPFLHHRVTPIHFNSTWDLLGLNSKCLCENDRDNSKDNLVILSANGSTKIILKCLWLYLYIIYIYSFIYSFYIFLRKKKSTQWKHVSHFHHFI